MPPGRSHEHPFEGPPRGTQPGPLPLADLDIRILRNESRLHLPPSVEVHVPPATVEEAQRLRLRVRGELFCDEMVLLYGRPLCWTGPTNPRGDPIRYVERVFDRVFALDSAQPELVTPAPTVVFPEGHRQVAWSYGVVLLRGDDPPWAASGTVRIHHRAPRQAHPEAREEEG